MSPKNSAPGRSHPETTNFILKTRRLKQFSHENAKEDTFEALRRWALLMPSQLGKGPPPGTETTGSNWLNLPRGFADSSVTTDFHMLQTWPNLRCTLASEQLYWNECSKGMPWNSVGPSGCLVQSSEQVPTTQDLGRLGGIRWDSRAYTLPLQK